MREAVAWALAAIFLAVILWPHGPASVDNSAELQAQNDSLRFTIAERTIRNFRTVAAIDSSRRWYDSAWHAQPAAETLYIGHHAQAATLPYRRKWYDMGVLPVDTAGGHAE